MSGQWITEDERATLHRETEASIKALEATYPAAREELNARCWAYTDYAQFLAQTFYNGMVEKEPNVWTKV